MPRIVTLIFRRSDGRRETVTTTEDQATVAMKELAQQGAALVEIHRGRKP